MTRQEYLEAVFAVTGGAEWDIVKESLEDEIRSLQVRAMQAETWEEVCELRGMAKAYVVVYNMRQNAKLEKGENDAAIRLQV